MKKDNSLNFGKRGWELAIFCLISYFCTFAAVGSMNMLAVQLNGQFGWSLTTLYSFQTIGGIICVIAYAFLGAQLNRGKVGIRTGLITCGIISAVLIASWAACGSVGLVAFVIIASVTYLFAQTWTRFFNDNHVANWFPTKKGAVMGITTLGMPVGSSIGIQIYLRMQAATGSYVAFYIVFAIIFAALALWGFLRFRPYPESVGAFPDNDRTLTKEKAAAILEDELRHLEKSPWTQKHILATWQIWVLAIGLGFIEFYACMINQMMPNLLSLGNSEMQAANMMMFLALGAGVFSIFWGLIDQKIGPQKVILLIFTVAIIGSICRFTATPAGAIISIIALGSTVGGGPNMMVSLISTLWGRYNFKKVFGTIIAINTIFAAFGVILHSAVAEASGYGVAYLVQGAGCAIGLILIGVVIKPSFVKKCEEKWGLPKLGEEA